MFNRSRRGYIKTSVWSGGGGEVWHISTDGTSEREKEGGSGRETESEIIDNPS